VVLLSVTALLRARIDDVDDIDPFEKDRDRYEAAAGWLIFVSVMGIVIGSSIVIVRFLNVLVVNRKFSFFGLMVRLQGT